jgi:hypothetical protein
MTSTLESNSPNYRLMVHFLFNSSIVEAKAADLAGSRQLRTTLNKNSLHLVSNLAYGFSAKLLEGSNEVTL